MALDPIGLGDSLLAPVSDIIGGLVSFGADIIGSILAALFGGLFGGGDIAALNAAVLQLRQQLATAVDQVTRFTWTVATALGAALRFLYNLLQNLLNQMWTLLKKLAGLIVKVIQNILPKILQAIKNARTFLQWVYRTFIRPIIQYLQLIRRFLAILTIFHVKWAAKLDGVIVNIESRIVAPFLYVLRSLNGIGQWVNVILTAGAVIQRAVFINTMYAYQADWVNLFYVGQTAGGLSGQVTPTQTPTVPPTQTQVQANVSTIAQTGNGPDATDAPGAPNAFLNVVQSV